MFALKEATSWTGRLNLLGPRHHLPFVRQLSLESGDLEFQHVDFLFYVLTPYFRLFLDLFRVLD